MFKIVRKVAFSNIIRYMSQFILGIVIASHLGAASKGFYHVFTMISATLSVLASFGIVNSLVYYSKKNKISILDSLKVIILLTSAQFFFLIFIFSLCSDFIGEFFFSVNELNFKFVLMISYYTILSVWFYFLNSIILSFRYMKLYFYMFSVGGVFSVIILSFSIYMLNYDIISLILGFIIIESIFTITTMCILISISPSIERSVSFKEVVTYAMSSYLGVSGSTLTNQADSIIITSYFSTEVIGIYSVAKSCYRLVSLVPQTVNSTLFGYYCEMSFRKSFYTAKLISFGYAFFGALCVLFSILFLEEMIVMVFGLEFIAAYYASIILIISAVIVSVSSPVNPLLLSINKPLISSKITIFSSSISILVCLFFAKKFGITGAALSTLLGAIVTCTLRFYYFYKFEMIEKNEQ